MMKGILALSLGAFVLSNCSPTIPDSNPDVQVRIVEVPRPAPIVPKPDQLNLRLVNWEIITPENVEEKFAQIQDGRAVFFALTEEGYKALAMNLSDIMANIQQQQTIIAVYEDSYR